MRPKVLITGVGGAAGIALIKALDDTAELFVADMDEYAAGLYLVPEDHAFLIPRADDPDFVTVIEQLSTENQIQVLFPTVDVETERLVPIRSGFSAKIIAADADAIETCLDKHRLIETIHPLGHAPASILLSEYRCRDRDETAISGFPLLVKPRRGRGSDGIEIVPDQDALERLILSYQSTAGASDLDDYLLQEYLPGAEYSIDVLADQDGRVLAVVPRERLKVDSGIAVAARTIEDPELMALGKQIFEAVGLNGIANVQLRRDHQGVPKLLEINPRFPGTVAITIASGVNIPQLLLDEALGIPIPEEIHWQPTTMVRYLADHQLPEGRGFLSSTGRGRDDSSR